jgi:hypothetical protein
MSFIKLIYRDEPSLTYAEQIINNLPYNSFKGCYVKSRLMCEHARQNLLPFPYCPRFDRRGHIILQNEQNKLCPQLISDLLVYNGESPTMIDRKVCEFYAERKQLAVDVKEPPPCTERVLSDFESQYGVFRAPEGPAYGSLTILD